MSVEEARALADRTTQKEVARVPGQEVAVKRKEGYAPYSLEYSEDCPIEPIGLNGDNYYFLDKKRHLHVLKGKDVNKGTIIPMLGEDQDYKFDEWPRMKTIIEDGKYAGEVCIGWRPEQATEVLIKEAHRRGVWDVQGKLRGPGAWLHEDGSSLVLHCGDTIFLGEASLAPGKHGPFVYSSASRRPYPDLSYTSEKLGLEIFEVLKMWNWVRPYADPFLALGFIGCAIVGGALKWRPLIWITGDKATGKSTLQRFIRALQGEDAVIASSDSTAAGIWQRVGHMTLPVALDEIEASTDNRKAQGIINLARQASSGDQMLRGGSDHTGASFTVRNCFMFSSILIPPMQGQDISRMAFLNLNDLAKDATAPTLDEKWLSRCATELRGRIVSHWHRLPDLIAMFKEILAKYGHGGRGGDQFGTLLAMAWLLSSDIDPTEDELIKWGEILDCRGGETDPDHKRCVHWLMSSMLDVYRGGEKKTVAEWAKRAAAVQGTGVNDHDVAEAKRALGNAGMGVGQKIIDNRPVNVLFVANDHQGLTELFRDSHWIGQSGSDGVWAQALRRTKGAMADQQRFSGIKKRCTAIPFPSIFDEDADDE